MTELPGNQKAVGLDALAEPQQGLYIEIKEQLGEDLATLYLQTAPLLNHQEVDPQHLTPEQLVATQALLGATAEDLLTLFGVLLTGGVVHQTRKEI